MNFQFNSPGFKSDKNFKRGFLLRSLVGPRVNNDLVISYLYSEETNMEKKKVVGQWAMKYRLRTRQEKTGKA